MRDSRTRVVLCLALAAFGLAGRPVLAAPSIASVEAYVAAHPESASALFYLGRMYDVSGDKLRAVTHYRKALRLARGASWANGLSPRRRLQLIECLANAYLKLGQPAPAAKLFAYVLKHRPDEPFALRGLREAEALQGGTRAVGNTLPGDGQSGATTSPARSLPAVTAAQAREAYDAAVALFDAGKRAVEGGKEEAGRSQLTAAREKFQLALDGGYRESWTRYYLGAILLKLADPADLEEGRAHLEAALRLTSSDPQLTAMASFTLAATCGLLDDLDCEIAGYESSLESKPQAETHYRLALAYDKSKRPDASARTFDHARAAIELDPAYKRKFQPIVRDSEVARRVASIIKEIVDRGEDGTITDEEASAYADRIGQVLGSQNLRGELLGSDRSSLEEAIKDPQKRRELQRVWDENARSGSPELRQLVGKD